MPLVLKEFLQAFVLSMRLSADNGHTDDQDLVVLAENGTMD